MEAAGSLIYQALPVVMVCVTLPEHRAALG